MGWNDVRISLVPAGWKAVAELDPAARTTTGDPVAILHTVPDAGVDADPILPEPLQFLLKREGFAVSQHGGSFLRMDKGEIEAFLAVEHGIVSEIILTFTLDRASPSRVPEWQGLVGRLVEWGGLGLVDRNNRQRVGGGDFVRLLTTNPAWRDFARANGWPESVHELPGRSVEGPAPGSEFASPPLAVPDPQPRAPR